MLLLFLVESESFLLVDLVIGRMGHLSALQPSDAGLDCEETILCRDQVEHLLDLEFARVQLFLRKIRTIFTYRRNTYNRANMYRS